MRWNRQISAARVFSLLVLVLTLRVVGADVAPGRTGELKVALRDAGTRERRGILRFAALASARAELADEANGTPRQQEPQGAMIRREVRLALVEATVRDKSGKAMKSLKEEDFLVYEDGRAQAIGHFSQDQLPLAVALLVDLSTSIQTYLGPLRVASRMALGALKPEDEVAVFTFASRLQKRVDLTHDKQKAASAIEDFRTGGGTNINNALYEAARYLQQKAPAARRVIVLVSDNMPTVSGAAPDVVLKEVLKCDAAVYSLQVPSRNPKGIGPAQWMRRGLVNVKEIARETGGEVLDIAQQGSLQDAFRTLVETVRRRYTLGFYPEDSVNTQKLKRLEVKLRPEFGVKGKDYTLASKSGYYAAESKPR